LTLLTVLVVLPRLLQVALLQVQMLLLGQPGRRRRSLAPASIPTTCARWCTI
jgi:hypothetical protein